MRNGYPREQRNGSSATQWQFFLPKTLLSIQPTIFESVLPYSSILNNKKSTLAIPSVYLNHPRTYASYNLSSSHIQDYGHNSIDQDIYIKDSLAKDYLSRNENRFHDTIEEGVLSLQDNRESQYDKNFKHKKTTTTELTTNNDKVGSNAEPFHGQNLGHTEERNKPINRSPEIEIPSIYNDTEVELLKTAELIQVALDASDALDLLQNGYHRNGMILLKSAARRSHAESIFNLGVIYERGLYGKKKSISKAIEFYVDAAHLNYPPSLYNLGVIHENNLKQDLARKFFERAAELKFGPAMKKLGHNMDEQKNGEQKVDSHDTDCNYCKDLGWEMDTGETPTLSPSCPKTCYRLAKAYQFGTSGMPLDKAYALALYKQAADSGYQKAIRAYEKLHSQLSPDPLKQKKDRNDLPLNHIPSRTKKPSQRRKVPTEFLKEYFLGSNIKSKIFPRAHADKTYHVDGKMSNDSRNQNIFRRETEEKVHFDLVAAV